MDASVRPTATPLLRMLAPESIAVVGASPREDALSRRFVSGLIRHGFPGRLVPVNPNYDEVDGRRCVPSIADAGQIDLAILAVPKRLVLESLHECAAAGVAGAVVFASGYAETGPEGAKQEREIREFAKTTDTRVLGPNSPGFINVPGTCCAIASGVSFREQFKPGGVAVLAQSGGVAGLLTERAQDRGVGLSLVVSTGNEVDVSVGELLAALADDPTTRVAAVFLEGIRDGDGFRRGLEAMAAKGKTAVVFKTGATDAAARASEAHTGALATADEVLDAVLDQHGAHRAITVDDLIDSAAVLARHGPARSEAVGIVSTSGGAGVVATAAAESAGLTFPPLREDTRAELEEVVPGFASLSNPADMSGMFVENPEIFRRSLEAFLADEELEAVVLVLTVQPPPLAEELAERVIELAAESPTPVVVLWIAGTMSEAARERLRVAEIPVIEDADRCMRALAARVRAGRRRPAPRLAGKVEPQDLGESPNGTLLEHEALALVEEAGVQVAATRFYPSRNEAQAATEALDGQLAVKAAARDLPHKAAVGAVELGIRGAEECAKAADRVTAAAVEAGAHPEGVIVQELAPPGFETIVGVWRDRTFGPVIVVGPGGHAVELLSDVVRRILPLAEGDAEAMLEELHRRGSLREEPAAVGALVDAIERIADLALGLGNSLEALEVNPLIVHRDGVLAVDALVLFSTEENQ